MPNGERRRFALNAFSEKGFINKTGGKVGNKWRRGSKGEIFDGLIAMNSFRLQPFCARLNFSLFFLKFWSGPVKMKFIWIAFFIAELNFSSLAGLLIKNQIFAGFFQRIINVSNKSFKLYFTLIELHFQKRSGVVYKLQNNEGTFWGNKFHSTPKFGIHALRTLINQIN